MINKMNKETTSIKNNKVFLEPIKNKCNRGKGWGESPEIYTTIQGRHSYVYYCLFTYESLKSRIRKSIYKEETIKNLGSKRIFTKLGKFNR